MRIKPTLEKIWCDETKKWAETGIVGTQMLLTELNASFYESEAEQVSYPKDVGDTVERSIITGSPKIFKRSSISPPFVAILEYSSFQLIKNNV